MNYKALKKVLKHEDDEAFFKAVNESLKRLDKAFTSALSELIAAGDTSIMADACKLASWVRLQCTAARKILKKRDKQHPGQAGAAWLAAEWGRSSLFGKSSALLHDLLLCLSLHDFDPVTDADTIAAFQGAADIASDAGSDTSVVLDALLGQEVTAICAEDSEVVDSQPPTDGGDEGSKANALADRLANALSEGISTHPLGPPTTFPAPCTLFTIDLPPLPPADGAGATAGLDGSPAVQQDTTLQ